MRMLVHVRVQCVGWLVGVGVVLTGTGLPHACERAGPWGHLIGLGQGQQLAIALPKERAHRAHRSKQPSTTNVY